ncbi:MFS transporter [Paenibacillus arenilitoris]|uniref:MFS transporter n=1 Tax=Paenibacillus arenilitoris TaxID=2772299 RepID=A0A927CKM9_9BACL|nr:MFS transporter [Paenibacillus arenilitoris]MBD2867415.1 MFS transporter [Paenibacillus arenilitoris]
METETIRNNGDKLMRVLAFTLVFSVMNATMFNVVMPVIGKEFAISPSQVSWLLTGYMIVYAVGSVTYGKLADKYRLKDLITFGLLFFALGSVVGLIATQYWMIVLGRILQATGAAVIPATAMLVPVRYFAPEKRGRALGVMASGLALGTAIAPIVSGLITGFASWRFLFLLSVLPLLALPFFRKYLNDERGGAQKIDYLGGVLLGGSVALLLLSISLGRWLLAIAGLAAMILFVIRIRTAAEPFVQPKLFRNKKYSLGLFITFLATAMSFGMPFLTPQFLSGLNGLSPAVIGLVMFPAAITSALLGRRGGKLADEKGNSFLTYAAVSLSFICFVLLSVFVGASPYLILFMLIFGNIGQTFIQIALSNTISTTLAKDQTGVGMGLMSLLNFISGAMATSIIGKLLDAGDSTIQLNPLALYEGAGIYSDIFFALALLAAAIAALYFFSFSRIGRSAKQRANEPASAAK